jgi:hypothetical protein
MRKDKWYKPYFKMHVLDKKAAEAMDVTFTEGTPETIKDFTPLPASIKPASVPLIKIVGIHGLGKYWNYPALIESLEAVSPDLVFSRADVKEYIKHYKLKVADTTFGDLTEILLSPKSPAQELVRAYWLEDFNANEILKYLGVSEELLVFLASKPEPVPRLETENGLKKLTSTNPTIFLAAELTDQARQGKFHSRN